MGLDMFMIKTKKGTSKEEVRENWGEEVTYWRKANQIHKWFVDNVQDGEDDCDYYPVSCEKLKELRDTCYKIICNTKLIETSNTEKVWDVDAKTTVEKPIKMVDDEELCEELLPTQEGFFFGSYDYDEYYFKDVLDTYMMLTRVLKETNFDEDEIYYSSSW